jgi:hypothetical protein
MHVAVVALSRGRRWAPRESLAMAQRTAALLAADIAAFRYIALSARFRRDSSKLLVRLLDGDKNRSEDASASTPVYSRRLLSEAVHLDSTSAAGRAALAEEIVFEHPGCENLARFQNRIERMERVVNSGDPDPHLKLMLAASYAELISFATDARNSYDGDELKRKVPAARARAIQLAREALGTLPGRGSRYEAWSLAARVALGLRVEGWRRLSVRRVTDGRSQTLRRQNLPSERLASIIQPLSFALYLVRTTEMRTLFVPIVQAIVAVVPAAAPAVV